MAFRDQRPFRRGTRARDRERQMIFAQDADALTYPTCATHGWSILNSASTNAGIAGVLAGFAFTAGVVYIGRERSLDDGSHDAVAVARHIKARSIQDVQTVSLFVVSFVLLGLDSFVWSVVAGSRPVVGLSEVMVEQPPELCSRVWSQAIIAVGMFGLGAIAMVCNITSLFLWQQSTVRDEDSRNYLRLFLLIVTSGAVLGVICFVGSDAMNYLDVLYGGHPPVWFTTATVIVTFGGLAIALAVGARAYFARLLNNDHHTVLEDRMRVPSFLIALYALIGAIGVTAAARFPDWPRNPATWLVLTYWAIGLVLPVVVVILVARAIPAAKFPRRSREGGSPWRTTILPNIVPGGCDSTEGRDTGSASQARGSGAAFASDPEPSV